MKEIKFFTLIPLQLLLMYLLGSVVLLYTDSIVILQLSEFICMLVPFLLAIFWFKDVLINDWKKINISWWKIVICTLIGVAVLEIVGLLIYNILPAFPDTTGSEYILFSSLSTTQKLFYFLFSTSALLTAVTEEINFRYLFLGRYTKFNKVLGLILSSILFGLAHYFIEFQLLSCLPYMAMGLVLGLIYMFTKNIWSVIFIHVTTNLFFAVLILLFNW
ncbi:CPBP family intramembrane metalloprotease [Listeria sp. FSL L7-1485]|uniref:CPBP family intramembrane metalloprotease n=1 Tax=Listeria immobilis TaxID=2713502 RepID=A0A7X0X4Y8_9LIST|nr:type II CAAX endopeptidase family protein [Listeria immobilis]MBC1481957.1 CPBP family intramembrane metalloprotease [Listeria immobilis]MBC1487619.1 CPBP family intramembrane metalloprotease [Listeria immobilis]MBC1517243.1 CPBP family intramembrane metalloprotease [Listeria immobilis]MBC1534622.1 CPBP family intramembrane metalloprotease [Listeria immobilis]MBC6303421.1 CPBP family intramembrane metalloprotease [Listeria immobilis]